MAQSVSAYLAYSWQVIPVPSFIDLVNHCPLALYELILTVGGVIYNPDKMADVSCLC